MSLYQNIAEKMLHAFDILFLFLHFFNFSKFSIFSSFSNFQVFAHFRPMSNFSFLAANVDERVDAPVEEAMCSNKSVGGTENKVAADVKACADETADVGEEACADAAANVDESCAGETANVD